jgi:hypothetical protein
MLSGRRGGRGGGGRGGSLVHLGWGSVSMVVLDELLCALSVGLGMVKRGLG